MILDLLGEGYAQPITLVHGARTAADLYGYDEFTDLAARHPNFRYVPALSAEPEDSAWSGERGFAHGVAGRQFNDLLERHIFTERFLFAQDGVAKAKSPLFKKIQQGTGNT